MTPRGVRSAGAGKAARLVGVLVPTPCGRAFLPVGCVPARIARGRLDRGSQEHSRRDAVGQTGATSGLPPSREGVGRREHGSDRRGHGAGDRRAAQQASTTIPIVMVLSSDPVRMGACFRSCETRRQYDWSSRPRSDRSAEARGTAQGDDPRHLACGPDLESRESGHAYGFEPHRNKRAHARDHGCGRSRSRLPATSTRYSRRSSATGRSALIVVIADPLTFAAAGPDRRVRRPSPPASGLRGMREFVEEGGLMSYGTSVSDRFRARRLLRRPVAQGSAAGRPCRSSQPARFEMVINEKAAQALA